MPTQLVENPPTWGEYAEQRDLSENEYPGADLGPDKQGRLLSSFVWLIVAVILRVLCGVAGGFVSSSDSGSDKTTSAPPPPPEQPQDVPPPADSSAPVGGGAPPSTDDPQSHGSTLKAPSSSFDKFHVDTDSILSTVVHWLTVAAIVFVVIMAVVFVVRLLVYVSNIIHRSRNYERDIISNDREARAIKKKVLASYNVNNRIAEIKRKQQKDANSSSSSKDVTDRVIAAFSHGDVNVDDENKLKAWESLKTIIVRVNTREERMGDGVTKKYVVKVDLPTDEDIADIVGQKTKNINDVLRRIVGSKIVFGDVMENDTGDFRFTEASVRADDKYAVEEVQEETVSHHDEYEFSFSDDIFADHSMENRKKYKKVLRQAEDRVDSIGSLLTSDNTRAKLNDIRVNAATVVYSYEMSKMVDTNNLGDFGGRIDNIFQLKGTTVEVEAGHIVITTPLPPKLAQSQNIATLYRDAFG